MADVIEVILALRNVSQFVAGAEASGAAVAGVGTEAEAAGAKASLGWKGMLKWAGGAAVLFGATRYIKSAVDATGDLAKSTLALQRQTGLDTQTASEWVSLTKERGISARQLSTSLTKLNKTIESGATGTTKQNQTIADLRNQIDAVSRAGGKDAPKQLDKLSTAIVKAQAAGAKARLTLSQLGVPISALQKGDTPAVLAKVANAFQKIKDPAERSALAQQLFGRSGQQLLPILMQGQAGINKLLEEQKSYGNYLTGHSIKDTKSMIVQQREMDAATNGLKLQLGQALLPVLIAVGALLVKLARVLRPVTSNAKALQIIIATLTATIIAYKVATIAMSVASHVAEMATIAWTAAQWALNIALDANPIGLIIIAIAALVVGFVVAYKKVGWFRDGVNTAFRDVLSAVQYVWGWIKQNWPLLVGALFGPFGIAVALIAQHFDTIKKLALAVVEAIKVAIRSLVNYIEGLPGKLGGVLKSIPGYGTAKSLLGHFATGGVAGQTGSYMVGERGPEIVTLPSGAIVQPIASAGVLAGVGGAGGLTIEVPVYLDSKVLTRAVARVTADKLARR
jgi:hypothetical protein